MVDSLTLQEILGVAGFLFGTVLHVILLGMIQRRRRRRPVERLFAFLVIACGLWNLGNFMAAFLHALLPEQPLVEVRMLADVVSVMGVAAIPSLSLHTLLSLLVQETHPAPFGKGARAAMAAVMYTPLTFLPLVVTRRAYDASVPLRDILSTPAWPFPSVLGAFLVWFILAFVISAALAVSLSRLRRHEAPRERTFYLSLSGILISTACLVLAIYLLGSQDIQAAGISLEILVILASTVPSLLFAYYIHRYNDVEFLLRRSLFYLLLMVAIVLVYLWGISALSLQLEKTYGLRHQLVEAILILGLVFLFHPFRRGLQRLFTRIFFRESYTYRAVLNDLVSTMRRGPVRRLSTLLDQVAWRMRRTLSVESARIILMDDSGRPNTASLPSRQIPRVEHLVAWLGHSAMSWVQLEDLLEAGDDLSAAELSGLEAEVVFAIRYERQLTGLFALGRKSDRSPFFAEELEVCSELADHLAVTVQTNRLYEEKLALERKILESEKLLSLGRFSASVAHRVKNPLSSIKAICQALGEDFETTDGRRGDLNIVVGEVDRLTEVINQLLHFAHPAKRLGEVGNDSPPTCNIHDLLREVSILFQAEADIYDVQIDLPAPKKHLENPLVAGSRLDLREIFSNLIQNGIHAMPRGGTLRLEVLDPADVSVTPHHPQLPAETSDGLPTEERSDPPSDVDPVDGRADDSDESQAHADVPPIPLLDETEPDTLAISAETVVVSVTDTGIGIRPENLAKVFEPFYTTKARGTGLGLAISRHKVDSLGGSLSVDSPATVGRQSKVAEDSGAPGPGTTFTVHLPLSTPLATNATTTSGAQPADTKQVTPPASAASVDSSAVVTDMAQEPSIG